jgi:hypothetical protein
MDLVSIEPIKSQYSKMVMVFFQTNPSCKFEILFLQRKTKRKENLMCKKESNFLLFEFFEEKK